MACEAVLHDHSLIVGEPLFRVHHDLSATPIAARQARRFVAAAVAMLEANVLVGTGEARGGRKLNCDLLYRAQLVVSELVTNAVMHARTHLHLGITCDENVLLIAVSDGHPDIPRPRGQSPDTDYDESGRGMTIVASLADDFGWRPLADRGGKVMWVTLAVEPEPEPEPV